MEEESGALPYRWGYFHGAIQIPWSLLLVIGSSLEFIKNEGNPRYVSVIGILLGLVGIPLSVGLLLKKKFVLPLVYASFALTVVLAAIKLPVAVMHYRDRGDRGSAFFEAEMLIFWLCCLVYYRKRQSQFS
jgi:hypothetical protein